MYERDYFSKISTNRIKKKFTGTYTSQPIIKVIYYGVGTHIVPATIYLFNSHHFLKKNLCQKFIPTYFQEKFTRKIFFVNCVTGEFENCTQHVIKRLSRYLQNDLQTTLPVGSFFYPLEEQSTWEK